MKQASAPLARRYFHSVRRLVAAATAVTCAFVGISALASPANAAPAAGFYSVPYSNTLYYHSESPSPYTFEASYDFWVSRSSPTPTPASTDFVKYPWSPTIYAVSYFDGGWVWSGPLAFEQWQKAGFPSPRNAGFIAGTTYHKWATSNEIFAKASDNTTHKLSYNEWAASGFQEPTFITNEGYQKLSWDNHIGYIYQINTGDGFPISYSSWAAEGFPTPQTLSRFPGDEFCQYTWSSSIYYFGPTWSGEVTYGQWGAAGYPRPTPC